MSTRRKWFCISSMLMAPFFAILLRMVISSKYLCVCGEDFVESMMENGCFVVVLVACRDWRRNKLLEEPCCSLWSIWSKSNHMLWLVSLLWLTSASHWSDLVLVLMVYLMCGFFNDAWLPLAMTCGIGHNPHQISMKGSMESVRKIVGNCLNLESMLPVERPTQHQLSAQSELKHRSQEELANHAADVDALLHAPHPPCPLLHVSMEWHWILNDSKERERERERERDRQRGDDSFQLFDFGS